MNWLFYISGGVLWMFLWRVLFAIVYHWGKADKKGKDRVLTQMTVMWFTCCPLLWIWICWKVSRGG